MGKFNIVLVLAFIAFQVSNGASLQKLNTNKLSTGFVQEIITEINNVIIDLTDRLGQLKLQLADKFDYIKDEAGFYDIISQLKNDIASASEATKSCSSAALYEAILLQKFVEKSTGNCKLDFNINADQLEEMRKHLLTILDNVNTQVFKCFASSFGSTQKFVKCMESTVNEVRLQLKQLKLAVEAAIQLIANDSMPFLQEQLEKCVAEAKEAVEKKAESILDDLHKCSEMKSSAQRELCWDWMEVEVNDCDDFEYINPGHW